MVSKFFFFIENHFLINFFDELFFNECILMNRHRPYLFTFTFVKTTSKYCTVTQTLQVRAGSLIIIVDMSYYVYYYFLTFKYHICFE